MMFFVTGVEMDIQTLKLFKVLADVKNITTASELCNISQPAASVKIKKLEESYATKFFNRTNKRFELTEDGTQFLQVADRILRLNQSLIIGINNRKNDFHEFLRIGATTGPANYILPERLAKYHSEYPDTYIKLDVSDIDTIIRLIEEDKVDFGLVGTRRNDELEYQSFMKDEIILCAGKATDVPDIVSKEDLYNLNFYLEQSSSSSRSYLFDWFATHDVSVTKLHIVGEVGLPDALKRLLIDGEGVAFLPETLVLEELEVGKLRRITISDLPQIHRPLYMVSKKRADLTPCVKIFVENYM